MTTLMQSSLLKLSSTNSTEISMKEPTLSNQYHKDPSKFNFKPTWKPPLYSKDSREFGKDLTNGDQTKFGTRKEDEKLINRISQKYSNELLQYKQISKKYSADSFPRNNNSKSNSKKHHPEITNSKSISKNNSTRQNSMQVDNKNSSIKTSTSIQSNLDMLKTKSSDECPMEIDNNMVTIQFNSLNTKSGKILPPNNFNNIHNRVKMPSKNFDNQDLNIIEESSKLEESLHNESKTIEIQTILSNKDEDVSLYTNPQIPFEFIEDIYTNMQNEEKDFTVKYESIKSQSDINDKMRAILVDWLIDVHLKFKLLPETLYLTINIIDRYISKKQILRSKLQLLGVSSLLISCKYEEIYSPELRDFIFITDKAFSKGEILAMETDILGTLEFSITVPSILRFLEIIALYFKFNEKEFILAKYFTEIFLVDFRINRYSASLIACTSAYIVMKLGKFQNIGLISKFSKKSDLQLKECAKDILYLLENIESTILQAVRKKYSSSKFYEVSKLKFC